MAGYSPFLQTRLTSWSVAPAIVVFGILSSYPPSLQSSDSLVLLQLAASLLVLGQVIHALPRKNTARLCLWLFALVPVVPYLENILAIRTAHVLATEFDPSGQHPVEALIAQAELNFKALLRKAVSELYRRLRRIPTAIPCGATTWI